MEEEEQDKGPTIEDVFSAISKTKSKFGMVNVPLPPKRRIPRSERPAVNLQEKINGANKNVCHQFDTAATYEGTSSYSKPETASSQNLSSRLNSDYDAHKFYPKFQTPSHTQSKWSENSRSSTSQTENKYGESDFLVKDSSSIKPSTLGPLGHESEGMLNESLNKRMTKSVSVSEVREKNEKEQYGLEKNWGLGLKYKEECNFIDHGQRVQEQHNLGLSRHDVEDNVTNVDLYDPYMSTVKTSEKNHISISQGNCLTVNTSETEKQSIINSALKDRETLMQAGEFHSCYATAATNTCESLALVKKIDSDMLDGSSGYQSQNMVSLNDNSTNISKSSYSEKRTGTALSKSLPSVDRSNKAIYKNTSSQSKTETASSQHFSLGISSACVTPKVDPKFQMTSHTRSKWNEDSRSSTSQSESKFGEADILVKDNCYMKLGTLGTGGSSVVYEVLDLESKKVRALKIVDILNIDEATLQGYKNEIAILERLQWSDRVITLYEYEQTPTQLKIVLEKGNGDLASLLNSRQGKGKSTLLSPFTIQHYWHGMLKAVQAIHKEGIIHSDLKPANFLLVCTTVKLIDFGIASSIQQDMTSVFKDSQAGTYNYMSPESLRDIHSGPIINGKAGSKPIIKIGVKSDVWSLGCILYNMVYGKTPFQHIGNPIMKLAAISNPSSKISFPVIENKLLLDTLKKCLQFDPKARPSIEELLEHPYLNEDVQEKDKVASPISKDGLGSVIQQLQSLTPNSLSQVTKMVEKLKKEPQQTVASQMQRNLMKDL